MTTPTSAVSAAPHHIILRLRVVGGFLAGAELEFADGLNCLIGGRGAGKTTALELLRFGLGLMPDAKSNLQRHRALDGLVKANLGGGRVHIELQTKTNMRYAAGRALHEDVQVLNESGTALPISLERDQIFSADVFSQNEIEEIASNPTAQLALLDRFQEQESQGIRREIEQLQRALEQSTVELRRIDDEISAQRGKAAELPAIEERLKGLVEVGGPDAAKINAAHEGKASRAREDKVPGLLLDAVQKVVRDVTITSATFQGTVEAQLDQSIRAGINGEAFRHAEEAVLTFANVLSSGLATLVAAASEVNTRILAGSAQLSERHATQEAEYRALISESEEQGGRAAERNALQLLLADAVSAAKEQQIKEAQRQTKAEARTDLLNRVSELRDQRFALRKKVAEGLTRQFPTIRVTVAQSANLERYRDLVAEALRGAGVKQGVVAERVTQTLLPTELSQLVAASDYAAFEQRTGLDNERSKRIIDCLKADGAAYGFETVDIEDRPCIELLDGKNYKESPNLSTGQRCTTILPILLVQSERPLLIDQPEDNLDNAFVYDTIVKALRDVKGRRQVIFVTHNPNIPVLGEAEKVFVFSSDGQRAVLRHSGNVDECKDQIERILEGGREAFLQRKARYGH